MSNDKQEDDPFIDHDNYFNFTYANEELGFDFDTFSINGFSDFLQTVFIVDFINYRKNFILRNYIPFREAAHKFKGSFKLLQAFSLTNTIQALEDKIKLGIIDIEDDYVNTLVKFHIFLEKLDNLAKKKNIKINEIKLAEFKRLNKLCYELEAKSTKMKIDQERDSLKRQSSEQSFSLTMFYDELNYDFEKKVTGCCCLIY